MSFLYLESSAVSILYVLFYFSKNPHKDNSILNCFFQNSKFLDSLTISFEFSKFPILSFLTKFSLEGLKSQSFSR